MASFFLFISSHFHGNLCFVLFFCSLSNMESSYHVSPHNTTWNWLKAFALWSHEDSLLLLGGRRHQSQGWHENTPFLMHFLKPLLEIMEERTYWEDAILDCRGASFLLHPGSLCVDLTWSAMSQELWGLHCLELRYRRLYWTLSKT